MAEAGERPSVVVLGSVHMDLIATAERLPGPGESVTGSNFVRGPGGKGGNQSTAFARLGVPTAILTRLGDDAFGRELLQALAASGVDISLVAIDSAAATGASTVFSAAGDYSSVIVPSAAARLAPADIDAAESAIAAAGALVVQLELPPAISAHAADLAARHATPVALNASPAPMSWAELPEGLRHAVSVLVVNRVEAGRLLGRALREGEDPVAAAASLARHCGVGTVLLSLGAAGAAAWSEGEGAVAPAFPAEVVDPVGAGDALLAAFLAARLAGADLATALRRGCAAGTIAVTRPGALAALPSAAEIGTFLAERG